MLSSGEIDRRTANHIQWEADQPKGAIKAKVGGGRTQAGKNQRKAVDDAKRESGQRVSGGRRARNNRREY
jgi:hypothetical protein